MGRQGPLGRAKQDARGSALAEGDLFVDGAQQGIAYLARHRRTLWGVVAALVLLAGGLTVGLVQRASTARAASAAFARALSLLERPTEEDRRQLAEARKTRQAQLAAAEDDDDDAQAPLARAARADAGADAEESGEADARDRDEDAKDADADEADAAPRRKPSRASRLAAQVEAEAQAEQALEQEADRQKLPRFATRKGRDAAGQKALLEVWSRYPKQPVGVLAALQGANRAGTTGDVASADATYAALFGQLSADNPLLPLVAARHAQARRRAGDVPGALAALERVARSEHRLLADEAALERAYLLEEQGERAQAQTELEQLALRFPDSPLQDEVRGELAALQAETAGGGGAAAVPAPARAPAAAGPAPTAAAR